MSPNFAKYLAREQALLALPVEEAEILTTLKCPSCGRTGRFVSMKVKCPGKHPARMMLAVPMGTGVWE
jgi:hypothetical protein